MSYLAHPSGARHRAFFELTLTVVVIFALCWLAAQMPASNLTGLGQRYTIDLVGHSVARAQNTQLLLSSTGAFLASFAVIGWIGVRLSRSRMPTLLKLLIFSACCFAGVTFWVPGSLWPLAAGTVSAIVFAWLSRNQPPTPGSTPTSPFIYPGWVLFTGIGLIWLLDYSANAHPKLRYLGLYQAGGLALAFAVFGMTAIARVPRMGIAARLLARFPTVWSLAGLYLLWVGVVMLALRGNPAVSSELLRLPLLLVGAWMLHRWSSTGKTRLALVGLGLALGVAALGLLLARDNGQALLIGLASGLGVGIGLAMVLQRRLGALPAALIGAAGGLAAVWLCLRALTGICPLLGGHIAERCAAVQTPFAGKAEYLSELRWLVASTPGGGFGLGQVPWCGTLAAIDPSAARCIGAAGQTHSDYVFGGLSATFGMTAAWLVTAGVALWLLALVRPRADALAAPAGLTRWLIYLWATVTLAQLLFTSLASVGLVPLSGVVFPLVGFGSSSLLVAAFFAGLAVSAE